MPLNPPILRAFTSRYEHIASVLKNEVFISAPFESSEDLKKISPPPENKFFAIWDTGATGCVISKKAVYKCGLKPTGVKRVYTAGDKDGDGQDTLTYLVSIFLPNLVVFPSIEVTEGTIIGADVLVGMEVINKGDFAVTNKSGKTVFTFRIPSIDCIDFVKNKSVAIPVAVGRKSPCPCGSGKKYKRCCGKSS